MVVSATMSLIVSAAPWVTFTAPKITAACTTSDRTLCTSDFFAFGLDSIRFSNTYSASGGGLTWAEGITRSIAPLLPEHDNLITSQLADGRNQRGRRAAG